MFSSYLSGRLASHYPLTPTRGDQKVLQLDRLAFMYKGKFCVIVLYDLYLVF